MMLLNLYLNCLLLVIDLLHRCKFLILQHGAGTSSIKTSWLLWISIKMHVSEKFLKLVTKNHFYQCAGIILDAKTSELL